MKIVLKTETDCVSATRVLCVSIVDADTGQLYRIAGDNIPALAEVVSNADLIITHTMYHVNVLKRLFGVSIRDDQVYDTFQVAKREQPQLAKHSLSAWAGRLGFSRPYYKQADVWTPYVQGRCDSDARIVLALYRHLRQITGQH